MSRKAKDKREARLIHGDEALEARGIDLDAEDETLLPLLIAAIGAGPDADLSIADWLGSIPLEGAARRLQEWDRAAPADKDLRRVIRASLFRLQQRGVAAAAREKEEREPVRILVEAPEPTAYLSPIDPEGTRLAWLCRPRVEGGLVVLSTLINDRSGMREVHSLGLNRSQLKEFLADAARDSLRMAAAPARYVDWLMHEAYRLGVPREDRGGGYPLLRGEYYSTPPAPVTSPVQQLMPAPPPDEADKLLADSGELFAEREFRGWTLPVDFVKVIRARLLGARTSTLVLSEEQTRERADRILEEGFDETYSQEARALYASRLAEMAYWYVLARPGASPDRRALIAYALHRALSDPGRALAQIPFLRGLYLAGVLGGFPRMASKEDAEAAERKEEEGSPLIVRPD